MSNNPARKMKRRNMEANGGPRINTGAAIDLGALKGPKIDPEHLKAMEKHLKAMEKSVLQQNGFLCSCGQKIAEHGVEMCGVWKGVVRMPAPPQGPGPQAAAAYMFEVFCSRSCQQYLMRLKDGLVVTQDGPQGQMTVTAKPIAVRPKPVEWLEA